MSTMDIDNMKIARDVQLSRSLFLSGIVILLYDHLLTIGSEIQYIWVTTHKRSSIWFLLIRYFSFAGNIVMALDTFGDFGLETCAKLRVTTGLIIVTQELIIGCTLFLRVYALYSLNRCIMYLLLCAGVVIVSVGAWSIVPVGLNPIVRTSAPGCYVPQSKAEDLRMAAAWTGELAGDILVIGLTLYRSYTQRRNGVSFAGSLWRIMIRDGVAYFGIICLVNMANILMFYFGDIYTSNSLSWLTSAISVAMISRLMLNLHVAATREMKWTRTWN
ncbi:hypothetical protein B0H16DRAFT_1586864 [Mycena metata]|uniref:DUF6533 domain-containing protein n=1 Tax=Mycena metata TaxID=1033252 RepID=A0AAD7MT47_9AGAR|nr:hypothetical protein B0H16DRAFT_1586864 [Mycena metata]